MSATVQVELIKKIVRDWALADDCSGVEAMIAIMEVLDYDPYKEQRKLPEACVSATSAAGSRG